jgi:hypothetical protein
MNLVQFLDLATTNGGGSYNINTGEHNPNTGYMVSLPFEHTHSELTKAEVLDYVLKHADALAVDNRYFGLWFDGGQWYYDVSENVTDLGEAIRLGMANNQLAIYDCAKGETIALPTRQKAGTLTQQRAYVDSVVRQIEKERKV